VQLDGHQRATDRLVSQDVAATTRLFETGYAAEREAATGLDSSHVAANGSWPRLTVRGKFLFVGEQKLYVRGTTYGTFRPDASGTLFPSKETVARDFEAMAANGLEAAHAHYCGRNVELRTESTSRGSWVSQAGTDIAEHARATRRTARSSVSEGLRGRSVGPPARSSVEGSHES
jgi:hypothetical protein